MKVIAIANQKGGCGKTTTSINLASTLSLNGKNVLLLDLDPQAHASLGLNIDSPSSIYNVISKLTPRKLRVEEIIVRIEGLFDLIPSNILVGTLEQELADEIGREVKLTEILSAFKDIYDYILIDCPPSLGFLTVNALRACDEVIVPVETSRFSLQGLERIMDIVQLITERLSHPIKSKALITMFDSRLRHSFSMLEKFKKQFSEMLFDTIIHVNVKLKESAVEGKTIASFDKYSRGFKDYYSLAKEMIYSGGNGALAAPLEERVNSIRQIVREKIAEAREEVAESAEVHEEIKESIVDVEEIREPISQARPQVKEASEGAVTTFRLDAPDALSVYVTGTFNNWSLDETCRMKKENGEWTLSLPLESGRHGYRFIIDGRWREDPVNSSFETNPFGEINSLVDVE